MFKVEDSDGQQSSSKTLTFNIATVDDLPTGADKTLTAIEDTALVVTLADFGYADVDNDAITGVKITTLESAGDLKLDGADVTLNQVITKADIEAGKLTFQGAANAEGSGYATAQFVVQNANGEDSAPNTLTFDVTAVEDEATGSVTFTTDATANAVQEGATVTADASGLMMLTAQVLLLEHDIPVVCCG